MRVGVALPEPTGPGVLGRLRDDLRRAADDGFSSAWMTHIFGLDALTALAVAASQVNGGDGPGIDVGTSVVPTYPRHPAALAQQALTAALAAGGRLTLGIGLSHKLVVEDMFGLSYDRPARHMTEYLSILVPLLHGEPASYAGETLTGKIGLTTPRLGPVPVVVAALGPRMLRLAGERADGTVLWMTGPKTVAEHIVPTITAAAEQAGRPAPRVVCILPICLTDDVDGARARAAETYAVYGHLPSYRAMLDREGAAGPADVAVVGDADHLAERLGALAAGGVTDFVADIFAGGDEGAATRDFLRAYRP